jgi:RsiW-degrading membrane proteinase PrsW (M82 family)
MAIEFSCACGKQYKLRDELAGKKAKCARCGNVLVIPNPPPPEPEPEPDESVDIYAVADPVVEETQPQWVAQQNAQAEDQEEEAEGSTPSYATAGGRSVRDFFYLALVVALVPLMLTTFQAHQSLRDRLRATVRAHPEIHAESRGLTMHRLLEVLPEHRLEGAWLAFDSELHWLLALIATGAFFGAGLFLLPRNSTKPQHAFFTGLFTGTAGVLLLLAVQLIANFMRGRIVIPRSVVGLFFLILKGIQLSYDAANDPNSNFFVSAFGFTFGVGLCEELCKALPVLWYYRSRDEMDWRGACLWGFLSGAGFGVSEAIMYSGDLYNGVSGADDYIVRFVSCIGLHGIWAAAAAIFICKHQRLLTEPEHWLSLFFSAVALVCVPMFLHGLYDTMLKKEMDTAALVVAIVSFGWLVYLIEQFRRQEQSVAQPAYA